MHVWPVSHGVGNYITKHTLLLTPSTQFLPSSLIAKLIIGEKNTHVFTIVYTYTSGEQNNEVSHLNISESS